MEFNNIFSQLTIPRNLFRNLAKYYQSFGFGLICKSPSKQNDAELTMTHLFHHTKLELFFLDYKVLINLDV